MTGDSWQVVSQMGMPGEGTIYGIRFRPGYIVMGIQKAEAEAIAGQHEEIKRLRTAEDECIEDRERWIARYEATRKKKDATIKKLASELVKYSVSAGAMLYDNDARIAELEAENKMLNASVAVGLDKLIAEANEIISKFHEFSELLKYQKRLEEAFLKAKSRLLQFTGYKLDSCGLRVRYTESERNERARAALDRIKEGKR